MIEEIVNWLGIVLLSGLKNFYDERQKYTEIETLAKSKSSVLKVDKNNSAEIYRFKDFNIVEFNTKANALDYNSMDALMNATDKPLVIINESMQFSAGVNLNYVMEFIKKYINYDMIFTRELNNKLGAFYSAMKWGDVPTKTMRQVHKFFDFS